MESLLGRTMGRESINTNEYFSDVSMFYLYAYLDPRKNGSYTYGEYEFDYEPFYIGKAKVRKGTGQREYDHLTEARSGTKKGNQLKLNKIRKIEETGMSPIIIKMYEGEDDESKILDVETTMIECIGRKDLGKGPLTNLTDGGEGVRNRVFTDEQRKEISETVKRWHREVGVSEETKKKLSIAMEGRIFTEEWKKKIGDKSRQQVWTDERRKKISESLKGKMTGEGNSFYGKHHSEETKQKIREKNEGANSIMSEKFLVITPTGEEIIIEGLNKFCKDNNLNRGVFRQTLKSGKPISKGKNKGWWLKEKLEG